VCQRMVPDPARLYVGPSYLKLVATKLEATNKQSRVITVDGVVTDSKLTHTEAAIEPATT
jgi:hypothetical protein